VGDVVDQSGLLLSHGIQPPYLVLGSDPVTIENLSLNKYFY